MAVGVSNLNQNNGGISAGDYRGRRAIKSRRWRPDELLPVSGAGPSSLHQHQSDIRRVAPLPGEASCLAHPFPRLLVVSTKQWRTQAEFYLIRKHRLRAHECWFGWKHLKTSEDFPLIMLPTSVGGALWSDGQCLSVCRMPRPNSRTERPIAKNWHDGSPSHE